ncbi:MAG: DNA translocase FtsK, partial [Duncaniella sp.]|nr:DNA translocase FtsK [Duncaniella sp.]
YEIIPAEGVRIAKIKRLEDDIALSLAALGIRIIAPIPGKGTIGIEVPNKDPQTVSMRSVIASRRFQEKKNEMGLPMAMGCTISNDVFIADLCKMPHLLVAGATGMGKSVGLNTIIASLLYTKHPAELKFVLVDPKMVEFSLYARLENHYLAKLPDEEDAIITDPSKVVATLNSLCVEMDNRYALLRDAACRNLKEYNDKFVHRHLNPEKGHRFMPYIVVIVDEFADLIMTAGKEVEMPIARLAQKARAVGMHVILATQRPSTNVITGIIKANFPGRIAFRVFQMVDSRTILDRPGANQLIGRGDMLFSNNGKIDRVQCAFIDTDEVEAICEAIGKQPGYGHAYELPEYVPESDGSASVGNLTDRDPLFDEAARLVVSTDTASTSSLQRRYSIGYNRAGKIMDQMEAAGIVGPSQGGKPRQVLVDPMTLEHILSNQA